MFAAAHIGKLGDVGKLDHNAFAFGSVLVFNEEKSSDMGRRERSS